MILQFLHLITFSRIQNLHISQTNTSVFTREQAFSRIQNLHISQTGIDYKIIGYEFSRIQNLHISQTQFIRYVTYI